MIKVCLIGDSLLTRNAYSKALTTFEDFGVLGDFGEVSDCVRFLENTEVDVVLIDIPKSSPDALETVSLLKEKFQKTKVIVIAEEQQQDHVLKVLSIGASGYVLKNIPLDNLVRIIRDAIDGNIVISSGAIEALTSICREKIRSTQALTSCKLTEREREILSRVSKGKSNSEIGKELCLSTFTVKNYVSRIIEKLEVKDRTQATAKAIQCGLV